MATTQHVEQSDGHGTSKLGDSVADGGKPVISHVGMGIKHEADNKTRFDD